MALENETKPPPPSQLIMDNADPSLPTEQLNPWTEGTALPLQHTPITPSLLSAEPGSVTTPATTASIVDFLPTMPTKVQADQSLLNQFDPLASTEESVKEAWSTVEPHPPKRDSSPRAPTPPPHTPPHSQHAEEPPSVPQSAPATTLSFPSIAAIGRVLSRPRSSSAAQREKEKAVVEAPKRAPSPPPKDQPRKANTTTSTDVETPPPFDFQKFLDQMKTKGAEPVAKYLRSFLHNFAKKTFSINEQIKVIRDFLQFIAARMRETDVWKNASDAEFDNSLDAMEKLVMNRLYDFTFTPQIDRQHRPIMADDLERDHVLRQRIKLFGWIEESHLDIPTGEGSGGFVMFAEQELCKINHYKAPRDKLICILNCCKVIFGLIRHLHAQEGADAFVPLLIFVVLKANPEHLLSNVEYINRFHRPSKLQSEAGYYLSSLMGAVSFIETMDHTSLSKITREEFEANVEQAIQELPPSPTPSSPIMPSHFPTHMPSSSSTAPTFSAPTSTHFPLPTSPHIGEESARPLVLPTTPFPNPSTLAEDTKRFLQRTGDLAQRTIGKPLDAIGKIFVEALEEVDENLLRRGGMDPQDGDYPGRSARQDQYDPFRGDGVQDVPQWALRPPPAGVVGRSETSPVAIQTPYRPRIRQAHSREPSGSPMATPGIPTPSRQPSYSQAPPPLQLPALSTSPSFFQQLLTTSGLASERVPSRAATPDLSRARAATPSTPTGTGLDIVAMQNEIDRAHEAANEAARETILQIFPNLDGEVADMILEANNGDLGLSIDKLLEMNLSPSA